MISVIGGTAHCGRPDGTWRFDRSMGGPKAISCFLKYTLIMQAGYDDLAAWFSGALIIQMCNFGECPMIKDLDFASFENDEAIVLKL